MHNNNKGKVKGTKVLAIGLLCLAIALPFSLCGCGSSSSKSSSLSDEDKVEFGKNLMTEGTPEHDWYENTYKKEHGIE